MRFVGPVVSFVVVGLVVACGAEPTPAPSLPASPAATGAPIDAAIATAPPAHESPAEDSLGCKTDAECVVTSFVGCCTCCPCGPLRAANAAAEELKKKPCAAESCPSCTSFVGDCVACPDPNKEGFAARCIADKCTLVETKAAEPPPPAPIACRTDDDCWIDDAFRPIARPKALRGKKIRPCKDGGHVPACKDGTCNVRVYKC